jgi:hypothetical protein
MKVYVLVQDLGEDDMPDVDCSCDCCDHYQPAAIRVVGVYSDEHVARAQAVAAGATVEEHEVDGVRP